MLLVEHGLLITVDGQRRIVHEDVAIEGDRIFETGRGLRGKYPEADRIDASHHVVTPGLVDAHYHLTEHIIRGLVPDDAAEDEWLPRWLLPVYGCIDEEEERAAAQLACVEMLRTGTTTFCEAGTLMHPMAAASAATEAGIHGIFGRWTWDLPPEPAAMRRTTGQALAQLEELLAGGIPAWPLVLGIGTASEDLIAGAHALAARHGTGFGMMHRASPREQSPSLRRLDELGVLDGRTKLTHEVYLEEGDIDLIAQRRVNVVHCPTAGLRHVKGLHRYGQFPEMLAAGVNVAIGGDSANGSNHADMTRLMWLCANLYKDFRMDVRAIPAETALEMATVNGARALLLEETGSIEAGKRADLVLWDANQPEWRPLLHPVNNLVHSATAASADTVIVGGRVVVRGGHCTTVDEEALYARVEALAARLMARAGVRPAPRWPLSLAD